MQYDLNNDYICEPYNLFQIIEKKSRVISAPTFRDLVAQHAIYRVIYDIFVNKMIYQSFGCRKGFGIHDVKNYIEKKIRYHKTGYFLQCDVRKYYYSLSHEKLKIKFLKVLSEPKLVDLIMKFAIPADGSNVGVPLGNLLSQLFGLFYLNDLDHYCQKRLDAIGYVRYVDDFLLLFKTKDQARDAKLKIIKFLEKEKLSLSKANIIPFKCGVSIVGYRIFKYKTLVKKENFKRFKKNIKKLKIESAISQLGMAKNTQSQRAYQKYLRLALDMDSVKT